MFGDCKNVRNGGEDAVVAFCCGIEDLQCAIVFEGGHCCLLDQLRMRIWTGNFSNCVLCSRVSHSSCRVCLTAFGTDSEFDVFANRPYLIDANGGVAECMESNWSSRRAAQLATVKCLPAFALPMVPLRVWPLAESWKSDSLRGTVPQASITIIRCTSLGIGVHPASTPDRGSNCEYDS